VQSITHNGFSLIETILYLALTSIIIVGLSSFWHITTITRERGQYLAEVHNQGLFALERITTAVRNATDIITPNPGTTSSTLVLKTLLTSTTPTVITIQNNRLYLKEGSNSNFFLTTPPVIINNILFTNAAVSSTSGSVHISFQAYIDDTSSSFMFGASSTFFGGASLH
jgi:Tfp pilus assembly protein PilW